LQLVRKSTHLPKCLLILLKVPIWIFFGGGNSLSHGSARNDSALWRVALSLHANKIHLARVEGPSVEIMSNLKPIRVENRSPLVQNKLCASFCVLLSHRRHRTHSRLM